MKNILKILNKKYIWGVLALLVVFVFLKFNSRVLEISGFRKDSVSEYSCNSSQRPIAVMLASDSVARPLSGLSQADLVFEMPVNPDGVTRILAVFKCSIPDEIGSIRSARRPFIDLAGAVNSIFVHWGGEDGALDQLNKGVLDNVDALKYEEIYFLRKKDIPRPHNGFINLGLLIKAIKELNYTDQVAYVDEVNNLFQEKLEQPASLAPTTSSNFNSNINIDYVGPFKIFWVYDSFSQTYKRFRGTTAEVDKNNNKQVEFDNIVVMKTTWSPINVDYIDVNVTGEGSATFYKNGQSFLGKWVKASGDIKNPLKFLTLDNVPFKFNPGKIWVEIVF